MKLSKRSIVLLVLLLGLTGSDARPEVPAVMHFQGVLTEDDGLPLDETIGLTFRLYEAPEGGVPLWSQEFPEVGVDHGFYEVSLGDPSFSQSSTLSDLPFDQPYYIEITVERSSGPEVLSPRRLLGSIAYSFRTRDALTRVTASGGLGTRGAAGADSVEITIEDGGVAPKKIESSTDEGRRVMTSLDGTVSWAELPVPGGDGTTVSLADEGGLENQGTDEEVILAIEDRGVTPTRIEPSEQAQPQMLVSREASVSWEDIPEPGDGGPAVTVEEQGGLIDLDESEDLRLAIADAGVTPARIEPPQETSEERILVGRDGSVSWESPPEGIESVGVAEQGGLENAGDANNVSLKIADDGITTQRILDGAVALPKIDVSEASEDGQVLTYEGDTETLSWKKPPVGEGGIASVTATENGGLVADGTTVVTIAVDTSTAQQGEVLTYDNGAVAWSAPASGGIGTVTGGDGLSAIVEGDEVTLDVNTGHGLAVVEDEVIVSASALDGPGLGVNGANELEVEVGDGLQIESGTERVALTEDYRTGDVYAGRFLGEVEGVAGVNGNVDLEGIRGIEIFPGGAEGSVEIALPDAATSQTLRFDGNAWTVNPALSSDGTDVEVSGTVDVGGFNMQEGAESGYVLTSDAEGAAAWEPNASSLPDGTTDETLRYDTSGWVSANNLVNDGEKIGIGTPPPPLDATLTIDGSLQVGRDTVGGSMTLHGNAYEGRKMLWNATKSALRAGRDSDGSHWTDGNTGELSVALGGDSEARGVGSFAGGSESVADGHYAFAFGTPARALGMESLAMGFNVTANERYSFALGKNITNDVENSFLIGFAPSTPTLFVHGVDHRVGIGTKTPAEKLEIAGGLKLGNTSNANQGTIRWNTSTTDFEGYDGADWRSLTTSAAADDGDWTVEGANMTAAVSGYVNVGGVPGAGFRVGGEKGEDVQDALGIYDAKFNLYGGTGQLLYSYLREPDASTDGRAAVFGYRTRTTANPGSGKNWNQANSAVVGFNYRGDANTFGVAGYSELDFNDTGAVLGAWTQNTNVWASLAYKDAAGTHWGAYAQAPRFGLYVRSLEYVSDYGEFSVAARHVAGNPGNCTVDVASLSYDPDNPYGVCSNVVGTGVFAAVVDTDTHGAVGLVAPVSPESWVQDYGSGTMSDGRASIELGDELLECVSIDGEASYKVFLQFTSPPPAQYFVNKGVVGFDVVDPSAQAGEVTFDYCVVAKRRGYATQRFYEAKIGTRP